ncbi:hypothetical protein Hypma_002324 [Hypsizygus marmoreus]|uniref:F-box domain-containing protein n=1 Tax=Hypsizygus marmoreus TaxID=39966 RepID=A0A369K7N4_HYPMA|nr:hypothetical protein Hypma_002324 [Hypsizygus marmoreus]
MAENLPNELIGEILQYVLHVPEEKFQDVSEVSPFSCPSHFPSAAVLAVCKRWMIVATPLLYQVVIIRSKAQAQALERTLRGQKEFGTCIKKLRLEGGYGDATRKIILASPNVSNLCISLAIRSSDSTKGLCKALATINPSCLVICDSQKALSNASLSSLVSTLIGCFAIWTNMLRIHLSPVTSNCSESIIPSLANATSLQIVTIPLSFLGINPESLSSLTTSKSLKAIQIFSHLGNKSEEEDSDRLNDTMRRHPDLAALVSIVKRAHGPLSDAIINIAAPTDPSFFPMAHASPEVRELVWNRIIQLATDFDFCWCRSSDCEEQIALLNSTRSSISVVSKTFQRLALPYIYSHPILMENSSMKPFALALERNPLLGGYVQSIMYATQFWSDSYEYRQYLPRILQRTPRVSRICGVHSDFGYIWAPSEFLSFSWADFETLAKIAGRNVISLDKIAVYDDSDDVYGVGDVDEQLQSPAAFGLLGNLRLLECDMAVAFNVEASLISHDWLANLESLNVSYCNPSFFDVLSCLDLNSLREVVIKFECSQSIRGFLRVHGNKIQALYVDGNSNDLSVLAFCPRLTTLSLRVYQFPDPKIFLSNHPQPFITKIVIAHPDFTTSSSINTSSGNAFFSSVDFSALPALRELQIIVCQWPCNEYDIERSVWVQWSSDLAKKWKIRLTDGEGRHWRPRLATPKRSKG